MKDINDDIELPFELKISFDKLLQHYETLAKSDDQFLAQNAARILKVQASIPILREGFSDIKYLKQYEKEINVILQESFSEVLTHNEIKTASVPFHSLRFNSTERFKKIIATAGADFELEVLNLPENDKYILACTIILNAVYGYDLDFRRPFFYEIPNANGIMRRYKILYNADFTEIIKTPAAPEITQEDYDMLLDNFGNMDLWREKFPPNSYLFKGYVVSNIFDTTNDAAISEIKSTLLVSGKRQSDNFIGDFQDTFRALFGVNDIEVGFVTYNKEEVTFERVIGKGIKSFLLYHSDVKKCETALCHGSYETILKDNRYFSISDVDKYFELSNGEAQFDSLHQQHIKSAIFAPIFGNNELLGVLELVSKTPKALNSVNANKLEDVMPFIVTSVLRSKEEEANLIQAIIQQECTSIHPSVSWKFRDAARKFIKDKQELGDEAVFGEIVFNDIYPLFGQMDVKGSSDARNIATQKDLALQLNYVSKIFDLILDTEKLPIYEQMQFQMDAFSEELKTDFKVDTEQRVVAFLNNEIEPTLEFQSKKNRNLQPEIDKYFGKIDKSLNLLYYYRKNYDDTISLINRNMTQLLDQKQMEAQKMYPHYFERYKTDGVEHSMYIGETITKTDSFNKVYLYNLRLWQLQVMCEMENNYYQNRNAYPLALDVASMILVFNQPLSIRFRMDEKQFDVDGTYNARYEVVKKRVDKAFIKGTEERITKNGKITIVYSQKEDEQEYLQYVRFLQAKKVLDEKCEVFELENLQGVTGLKAIRVDVLYHNDKADSDQRLYTYDDLINQLGH